MKTINDFFKLANENETIVIDIEKIDHRNLYGTATIIKDKDNEIFPFVCQDTVIVHENDNLAGILEETKNDYPIEKDTVVEKIINKVNYFHSNKKELLSSFFKEGFSILNEEGIDNFIKFVEQSNFDVSPKV